MKSFITALMGVASVPFVFVGFLWGFAMQGFRDGAKIERLFREFLIGHSE